MSANLSQQLHIKYPIIQAPMAGGATTPALVAAVSNAGGLGSLGAGYMKPDDIKRAIKDIRLLTDKPFAVNLFVPEQAEASRSQIADMMQLIGQSCKELKFNIPPISPPYAPSFDEQINVVVQEKVPIFSFTFGIPDPSWIKKLKRNNTLLIGTATNKEEAILLEKNGIDFIVAQGSEAGGHRGTFMGEAENSLSCLPELVADLNANVKTPIIAAGGIMDGKDIVASLSQGAQGVQIGTAFLTCDESGIHPTYKSALLNASKDNTVLTRAFSGKLARGINNQFISRMKLHENETLPYPIQHTLTSTMRKESAEQHNTDFMSLWAGQSVHLAKTISTAELMGKLISDIDNEK